MNILVKKLINEVELLTGSKLPGTTANIIWSINYQGQLQI